MRAHAWCVIDRLWLAAALGLALSPEVAFAAPAAPAPGQAGPAPAALAPGQSTVPETTSAAPETAAPETAALETAAPVVQSSKPVVNSTAAKAPPANAVDDAAWEGVQGRQVSIETADGPVQGELTKSDGDTLVVVAKDGRVVTLPKSKATGVRVLDVPAGDAKASMAGLQPAGPEPAKGEEAGEEELTKAEERRKKRREKREHAILGAFTMHGATYSHWRGDGINAGHASYAMDFGLGGNFSPKFGMYAMAGGLLGAKIDDKTTKANFGHVAALFAFGGKYYFSTLGAGVAFSRLRFEDGRLEKDRGLALPAKLVGKIPLPKYKLYIGLGLTYEFAAVRGFSRFVNAIGGQVVVGRW